MTVMRNRKTASISLLSQNRRGVALLIVLLVTALLIALIFEFSYATRISLNTAVNFRDSQRAYFFARAGITAFKKYGKQLRDFMPQGEWGVVPMISEGETQVMIKWEDETGKIKITDIKTSAATKIMVQTLFESIKDIDTAVVDKMVDQTSDINKLALLSGLHQYMSDEDFNKVYMYLTTASAVPSNTINVNTASPEVLQALGISRETASLIVQQRPYSDKNNIPGISDMKLDGVALSNYLSVTASNTYTVYAYATVGGYTKQVEAVVNGNSISYWRAL